MSDLYSSNFKALMNDDYPGKVMSIVSKSKEERELKMDEPLYPQVLNIGKASGYQRLDQVMDQIGVKEEQFIWWSSSSKLQVKIPPQLYQGQVQAASPQDLGLKRLQTFSKKELEANAKFANVLTEESVLNHKDVKIMLTVEFIFIFYLETVETEPSELDADETVSTNVKPVKVKDLQVWRYMDFEFIQKLVEPKRSFILQVYNKEMTANDQMPAIQVECSKDEQFFVMTHIIDRQLPDKWRHFFETSLAIQPPDVYQFHCFVVKKNKWGMS